MKLAKYLKWVLLGISAILLVLFFALPHNNASDPILDTFLIWSYVLVAVSLVLVVAFLLIDVSKSKKSMLTFLALLAGTAVLLVICWVLAPGGEVHTNVAYTPLVSKMTDAGLYLTYILVVATFVTLVGAGIRNAIKNR